MIFKSHLISMIVYSVFVCTVLALLRRDKRKNQIKYGLFLFIIMVFGALLFGWIMYLFAD
jgi:heme A synthase